MSKNVEIPKEKCWKIIGVSGDLSCPELSEFIHCRNCPQFTRSGRELFNKKIITKKQLDEWTIKNAIPKKDDVVGDLSIVPFRLTDEWFALPTNLLIGATEVLTVHSVPHRTNNIFEGLVNVNGELLCCVSAYEVLGLKIRDTKNEKQIGYGRMVTIKHKDDTFVFKVDELLRAQRISSDEMRKPPATLTKSAKSYTKSVFLIEGIEVGILKGDAFFKTLRESLNKG